MGLRGHKARGKQLMSEETLPYRGGSRLEPYVNLAVGAPFLPAPRPPTCHLPGHPCDVEGRDENLVLLTWYPSRLPKFA